jgi:hypothetical protein
MWWTAHHPLFSLVQFDSMVWWWSLVTFDPISDILERSKNPDLEIYIVQGQIPQTHFIVKARHA